MSVRKELLERELRKLGFRKAGGSVAHEGGSAQQQHGHAQQQQQPQGHSDHPRADPQEAGQSGEHPD